MICGFVLVCGCAGSGQGDLGELEKRLGEIAPLKKEVELLKVESAAHKLVSPRIYFKVGEQKIYLGAEKNSDEVRLQDLLKGAGQEFAGHSQQDPNDRLSRLEAQVGAIGARLDQLCAPQQQGGLGFPIQLPSGPGPGR